MRAQQSYTYQFGGSLAESKNGPKLTAVCKPVYTDHTFTSGAKKIVHSVCRFDKACGFIFNDTGNFIGSGAYTIEMYLEQDNISGYNKLIDYLNLTEDDGLYENDGACTFRGPGNVSGDVFIRGAYNFVAITRDGTTKKVRMYVNGQYIDEFTDDGERKVAMYDGNKTLRFLQDDNYSDGKEAPSGNIAFLRIFNYAADEQAIKGHYGSLFTTLTDKTKEKHSSIRPQQRHNYGLHYITSL